MISQIKDESNGKIINTIKDNLGRIIYEAWKLITKIGIPPLSLLNCKGDDLEDYKIYGNSIQDGTPTPEAPIEVESVGDKTKNILPYPYVTSTTTINGITITDNGDGTITINGTSTARTYFYFISSDNKITLEAGTYTPKLYAISGSISRLSGLYFQTPTVIDGVGKYYTNTFTLDEPNTIGARLDINQNGEGVTFDNYRIGVALVKGATVPSEYEPYNKYKIPVKTRRKNYFAIDGFSTTSSLLVTKINNTSFTLTAKTDGTYRQSGTKFLIRVADLKNNFLTVKAENVIKTSKGTPLFVIRQYDKKQQLLAQLNNCQLKTSGVKVSLSNLNPETAWLGGILCLSNQNETTGSYCTITDLQIYDGEDDSIITNIYLDEPLRKIGDYSDYIDFENQKVYRNVEVVDDTGTLILEESLSGVVDDVGTDIELPNIPTLEDATVLQVNTKIQPSNMEVKYKGLD